MMAILVHSASHSSMLRNAGGGVNVRTHQQQATNPGNSSAYLWDVRMTERPSLMMLWMQFQSARRALGSIPVVGSS